MREQGSTGRRIPRGRGIPRRPAREGAPDGRGDQLQVEGLADDLDRLRRADQPFQAERCVAAGVGRRIEPAALTPEALREAVSAILGDPSYRRAAVRLRDEMHALPGTDHGVALLERLAAERAPLLTA